MTTHPVNDTRSAAPSAAAPSAAARSVAAPALAWSIISGLVAIGWLLAPGKYPFGPDDDRGQLSLLSGVTAQLGSVGLLVLSLLGSVVAGRARAGGGPLVVGFATFYAVGFGLLVPDIQLLMMAAYAFAFLVPVALAFAFVATDRAPRLRAAVGAGVVALLVLGLAFGVVSLGFIAEMLVSVVDGFAAVGLRPAYLLFFLGGGIVWGRLAYTTYRAQHPGTPAWAEPAGAARWGRYATIGAAICAMPYAAVRATWLTPWPIGGTAGLDDDPALRTFGLLLGVACLVGAVLTIGLLRPWGSTWPRWVPGRGGRPVPVGLPLGAGFTVATLITVAAPSLVVSVIEAEAYAALLLFPFPLWGPLLGAATLAYWLRRRGEPGPAL